MIGGADHPSRRAGAAQAAPEGTAGAQQIEQSIYDLAQHRRPPSAAGPRRRQQRLDPRELGIGDVGCVPAARAAILMAGGSSPHRS